ncbi:MAG TPA: MFS transporter [Alcaligenes sp.]|nr:MFS transporter [Alcaligenes sp.]HRL28083.1 MFS transporter [Alcaligenes sp.]
MGDTPARKPNQWQPYLWVCLAMCVGVMGTALASPLYPLYQTQWNLSASHITQLYVAYMSAALLGLLFLGRLSDRKGFMPVLRTGLIVVTGGVTLSAFAWDVYSFLFSRIMIGLASSMIVTSASIGLTQLNRGGDLQRAAATTSLMLAFGFGLGPVVGGLIAQWAPTPLLTSYIPSILLGILAIYALFQITPPAGSQPLPGKHSNWRAWLPRIMMPAKQLRRPYLLGCLSACCAFAMFSLFASLAPSFMAQMVPWHGPATSGLSIGIILFLSSGFQLVVRRWPARRSVLIGLIAFALANLALLANLWTASSLLFVLCVLITAFGHGLCMVGGMSVVNKVSPPHQRAAMTSTYLVIAYLGAILPILGLGALADLLGLTQGLMIYCGTMMMATLTLAATVWRTRPIT